jgi:hypothetical protein
MLATSATISIPSPRAHLVRGVDADRVAGLGVDGHIDGPGLEWR